MSRACVLDRLLGETLGGMLPRKEPSLPWGRSTEDLAWTPVGLGSESRPGCGEGNQEGGAPKEVCGVGD